jgi:hypothetical protein
MKRQPKWTLRYGSHVALKTPSGYTPAMVLEDGGGMLVKMRYRLQGAMVDRWVLRCDLIPPPWVGCRRRR